MKAKLTAVFAALLVLAPAAFAGPTGVISAVKIARVVSLPAGEENVTVPVTLTLINPTDHTETLQAPNRCAIHIWQVTDSTGAIMDDRSMCNMIFMPQTNALAPGERQSEEESITLQTAQFHDGETYTLLYRYWNISAEAKFIVKREQ